MSRRHPGPGEGPRLPGDRLVAVGAALFGIGTLAALIAIVPLFVQVEPLPLAFYIGAALAPVGFASALIGMARASRARRARRRKAQR